MQSVSRFPGTLGGGLLAACLLLSACGSDSDTPAPSQPAPPDAPPPVLSDDDGRKALVVILDGMSYASLQDAASRGALAGFDALQLLPAWTGGQTGTLTEQATTGRPGFANLITGQWAWQHGVQWEQGDAALQTPSVFATLKQAAQPLRSAAVLTQANLTDLLRADAAAGKLDTLTDCATAQQPADCAVSAAASLIADGHDLTLAQLTGTADTPAQTVAQLGNAMQQLRQAVAQRQATHPKEQWLILATGSYGTDRYGSATGTQSLESKTVFIASHPALPALGTDASTPQQSDALYARASLADITPTLLQHFQALPQTSPYAYAGQPLQASFLIRDPRAVAGKDKSSLDVTWNVQGPIAQAQRLLRDGTEIAALDADARQYLDDTLPATTDGQHQYQYTLTAGDARISWPARIDFVAPVPLATTLTDGLQGYYSFDTTSPTDATGLSTLLPWDANADGGSPLDPDNFSGRWVGKAWRIDTTVVGENGVAGYRLQQRNGDITDNRRFTVGFWFNSSGMCERSLSNGVPLLSNKNWNSGGNTGITIGLWNSCEVRFNLGGSGRIDNSGHALTDGQWAYMALIVDRDAKRFISYVFDPVKGMQVKQTAIPAALDSHTPGLRQGFSLAEDGTGKYITNENTVNSPRGRLAFNELALWNRVLTEAELTSIYRSGRPLSSLLP